MDSVTPKPIRVGIIGCGALGVVHAQRLSALPGVSIVALSDPDEDGMTRVRAALPADVSVPATYADYRELLGSADLDAVSINSPNRWHVEQLLASLKRGLDVLCEKPLSMIPAEVEQVVEATAKSGRMVAIAYQRRYLPYTRLLRRALQSGRWGRITSVSVFNSEDWITPNVGTWRHDPDRCPGGFLADANGHQMDSLFWVTGTAAVDVRATIEPRGTPVPIVTWGEARLVADHEAPTGYTAAPSLPDEGVPLSYMFVGDAKHWREEIAIQTEGADFVLRDFQLLWTPDGAPLQPFPLSEADLSDLDAADTPDAAFISALRGGAPIASPPHTVWPVLRFTLAALKAAGF